MTAFISELKRRNVFKVGIAYAIVAWLIVQVISAIHTPLHLPDWFDTVVIVLLIIGFILAVILAWAYELTPEGIRTTTPEGPAQYHTRTTGQRLNYFIVGVLVLVVAFMVIDNYVLKDTGTSTIPTTTVIPDIQERSTTPKSINTTPVAAAGPVRRYPFPLGLTRSLPPTRLNAMVALSPDGLQLVYAVNRSEGVQLQHRNLNQLSSQSLPLPTESGNILDVFFSPDGKWVGVTTGDGIYKISLQGGAPQLLARITSPFGGHWTADGTIYFCAPGDLLKLFRVRDTGGTPEPVPVTGGKAGYFYSWPYLLPDGTHLLATQAITLQARYGRIVLVDLNSGKIRVLIQNGYRARYVPTGHIVFMRSGSLWAVPFDVKQLEITGPEVPVVQEVQHGSTWGPAVYAFSDEGLLVYLPGKDVQQGQDAVPRQLVWVDRDGTETPLPVKAQGYGPPRLSPDGSQVAVTVANSDYSRDIWTYDITRNILSRRTFSGNSTVPLWTPDGTRLAYSFWPDFQGLAWVRTDGTGQPEPLLEGPRVLHPTAFTPDGSTLIYYEMVTGPVDIYALSLNGEHTEQPLLATEFVEGQAALSPDGHWLAYSSDETGQAEIYVRPFPKVDEGKWQVSTDGGMEPYWRGDGKELYYRKSVNPTAPVTLFAVTVETEQGFQTGTPVQLFRGNYFIPPVGIRGTSYDVTADGQRFLFTKDVEGAEEDESVISRETNLVIVDNWFDELKRLAPPAN